MLELTIIAIYFLILIFIGVWTRGKIEGKEGYFVADRRGSVPFITGSLLVTAVGGSATVGMAGLGYTCGLAGAWWLLVGSINFIILGAFFAKKVRGSALYTLPELVEKQYDRRVGLAASGLIVIAWIGVVAAQIVAAGKLLSVLGLGPWGMIIFAVVFITYSILGGQFSVIYTDALQGTMIFAGIFVALILVLSQVGGIEGLGALPAGHLSFPVAPDFNWKDLLSLFILVGATYIVGPDIYSRIFSARDEKTAQKSIFLAALLFIPLAFAITLIGMGAKILYPEIAAEEALPRVISGVPLTGFILMALIAALMSSADTCLLTQSVILTEDMLNVSPQSGKSVLITRGSMLVLGGLALALAISLDNVIQTLLFAYTIFTCGLVVPVIAGFYKERLRIRVSSEGALVALIGGGLIGLMGELPAIQFPFKEDMGLLGFAASAILLFGVSAIFRGKTGKNEKDPKPK